MFRMISFCLVLFSYSIFNLSRFFFFVFFLVIIQCWNILSVLATRKKSGYERIKKKIYRHQIRKYCLNINYVKLMLHLRTIEPIDLVMPVKRYFNIIFMRIIHLMCQLNRNYFDLFIGILSYWKGFNPKHESKRTKMIHTLLRYFLVNASNQLNN